MNDIQASLIVEAISRGFDKVSSNFANLAKAERQLGQETDNLNTKTSEQEKRMKALESAANKSANVLLATSAAGTALIYTSAQLAARVETLGVVVDTLGANMGFTKNEMRGFEDALTKQGITLQKAREGIALMSQANIDLSKSVELAALAQNAAVIAGTDSSDAFQKLVYTISAGNIRMARTLGLQVNFQDAYQRTAEATGVATTAFSANEKAQIRLQEVLRAGANIQGAYDAAMTTAGKKVTSLNRYWEESRRLLGEEFLPVYGRMIDLVTSGLKAWVNMDEVTRKVLISVGSSITVFAGAGGAVLKLIGPIKSLINLFQIGAVAQTAFLGPLGLIVVGITAAIGAIVAYNAAIEKQVKANQDATYTNLEVVNSYDKYVESMQKYAQEAGVVVMTTQQYAEAQTGIQKAFEQSEGTMADYYAAIENGQQAYEDSKTAVVLLDEATFNLSKRWAEFTDVATAADAATKLQGASLDYYANHAAEAAAITGLFDSRIRESSDSMTAAAEDARFLSASMEGVVSQAMEQYAKGGEGAESAIDDVLFKLLELQLGTEKFGEGTEDVLRDVADAWGLTDDATEQALASIDQWLTEAVTTGNWDLFIQRITNLKDGYEKMAEGATDAFGEMEEAAGKADAAMDELISNQSGRSLGSPMKAFIEDARWFLAGGYKIVAAFETIKDAVKEGVIAPEDIESAMRPLIGAWESLAVQMGDKSKYDAILEIAKSTNVEVDDALVAARKQIILAEKLAEVKQQGLDLTQEEYEKLEAQAGFEAFSQEQYQAASEYFSTVDQIPGALEEINKTTMRYETLIAAKDTSVEMLNALQAATAREWEIFVNLNYGGQAPGTIGGGGIDSKYQVDDTKEMLQHGKYMVVPPGYPNDNYRVGLSSGEEVLVLPSSDRQTREINNSFVWSPTIRIDSQVDADLFMDQLLSRLETRLR